MKTTWLRPNGQGLPPVFWLGLVTLAGWTLCTTGPGVLLALGIHDYNWWFLDSYAVLAAGDAARAGLSPDAPNPFDPLLRNNKYSDWWYALNWLGLTRAHNFAVGLAWVGAFALAVGRTLTPRSWRETAWLAVLLLSPPVLMAVNRANNDLVIFVLLAVCGSWAVVPGWRQWVAVGALALATGLKFYPAPGCLALAGVRPGRRMPWLLLAAGLAVGGALGAVWAQMARGRFPLPCGLHVMGALSLGQKWGWTNPTTTAVFFAMVLLGAGVLVGTGVTVGLAERGGAAERLRAALGSLVLLACFGAGNSFGYRWILALWMGLWLWRRSAETPGGGRAGWGFRLGAGLLWFGCWGDGVFALVINLGIAQAPQARVAGWLDCWLRWAQGPYWLLMMFLAGWLLEAGWATVRAWRAPAGQPQTPPVLL